MEMQPRVFFIILATIACAHGVHAQRTTPPDTSERPVITRFDISGPELSIHVPTQLLLTSSIPQVVESDTSAPKLWTALVLKPLYGQQVTDEAPSILSSLRVYPKEGGPKTIRVVIGAVQAAGLAYGIYEHFRKYKNKY